MLNKKQSQCVGFNPFNKFTKENPSISTKIINKLKNLFQINLNPSSCIKRELISQQTIYVPVDLQIIGAQTIEHDSIQIHYTHNSIKQRRNKFMSFDDHLKEQQNTKLQQNELYQKVQQKEDKHIKKFNSLYQQNYDPVLPQDIDIPEIKKNNNIIHPKRKLSSQQYKKRKLDQKKKQMGIKFVYKEQIYDQIQDSINESRIKEVPEQMTDDSLKDNSLLVEPQNKEIIIIQLDDEKLKQSEPPIFKVNEIITNQQKGLKKSQSMINLNEQEVKQSISQSPKKLQQSDIINQINELNDQSNNQMNKQINNNKQQQNVINFIVQGSPKKDKIQNSNNYEEKKTSELQDKNINNFSDTPLFGFGKIREGQQGQIIPNKINVQSSIFASYNSKDFNLQNSLNQGQNLQQNQFTFLQNKPKISEIQQQPSNSDSIDLQLKIDEIKQINNQFNNSTENQNDQFRPKKQLFQNLINQSQSNQIEQKKEENKQEQSDDSNKINKSDIFSSDQIIKQVTTPIKQIDNPFLQQSPKIDQEQIISYFSNHSQQQNRINQDDPSKIQTSQFQDDLFKQQNNTTSMFNSQPQQSSLFSFQQFSNQQNQFLSNCNVFNNNNNNNNMEITDMPLSSQQFQLEQQSQNPLGSLPQLETNNFYPQIQQQISNGFNAVQFIQTNPQQQNEHSNSLLQNPQINSIFTTNQSQSLNSSFQSRNAKRKQRIDP